MAPKSSGPALLVLFDIDGTLVRRAGPHHRRALEAAVREVLGLNCATDGILVHGMLDGKILEAMLGSAGVSSRAARRHMPALMRAAQRHYMRNPPPSLRTKVCPGVLRLLASLRRRAVPAGLVSGNLSRIGWLKVGRAGLKPFFRFGMFAELADDRTSLVRLALRYAGGRGWAVPTGRYWLVGDHPNDVLAARANGILSVAVGTGLSSLEELAASHPDLLVEDLRTVKLEALLG